MNRYDESAEQLRWPNPWASVASARNIAFAVFAVVLWAFMVSIATLATLDRDPVALLFWWGALLTSCVAAFVYRARLGLRRRSPSRVINQRDSESGRSRTVIGYSGVVWAMYWAMACVCLAGFAFLAAISGLALVADGSWSIGSAIAVVAFTAAAAYLAAFCLQGVSGRLGLGYVALSPEGVFHRGWTFRAYAPWDNVIAVEAAELDGPLIHVIVSVGGGPWVERTSRLWKQAELALAPSLAIRGRWLSVDPALLYHALRYYHAHPEARPELASPAGVQRLQEARLTAA